MGLILTEPSGTSLIYSTYLGGAGNDFSLAVALDSAGNAYVTGYTTSTDFPTTSGVFKTSYSVTVNDAFVTKVNPSGTAMVYSTFLGGGNSSTNSITVNSGGNAFVAGNTSDSSYTTTGGAFQTTYGGGVSDGILAELNSTATALVYYTYLGGSMGDGIRGSTVDSNGSVYLTGDTDSNNFPTSAGAFNTTYNGSTDVFVSRIPTNSFKTCAVNNTSDNAATAGGFRNALSQSPRCDIITFTFASATTISVTGSPLPNGSGGCNH